MQVASLERLQEIIAELKTRISSKVSKSGDTVSGDLTVSGQVSGGTLQVAGNIATNTAASLFCVMENNMLKTRTADQLKEDLGVSGGGGMNATIEENVLVFISGATVENNVLIVG